MPRQRNPLPKGVPRTLRFESITFEISALKDGRLQFAYYDGSKRIPVRRHTVEELREEAGRIATAILNADTAALDMTADERRIYVAARAALAPISVDAGARILAEAAKLAGGFEKVIEACRCYSRQELRDTPSVEIVAHFIRYLSADGLSSVYVDLMEQDLGSFTARFPGSLAAVRAAEIEDWLRERPVGLRRRRNLRDKVVALFNFGRAHNYLPEGLLTEAEKVKRPRVPRKAPAIFTPEELDLLLSQSVQPPDKKVGRRDYADFIPPIAIGAFAGLRWSEIQGLEWSRIHWSDLVIEVGEEHKTGFRLVPIQPNLLSWLSPYRSHMGPVCRHPRPDNIMRRLSKRAGLPVGGRRYANGLRHSYVTYRVAVTKNMPLVSAESGHSVTELRKSYNRASLESSGLKWFSISRDVNNVLQMPLLSMRG